MYRSRPRGKITEDTMDFLNSLYDDIDVAQYDIIGSQAHSIMLHTIGILDRNELKSILNSLNDIKKYDFFDVAVQEKENFEDIHEFIESEVIKKSGMKIGGKMHTARSRNDQVVVDMCMKVRDEINFICSLILDLENSILERSKEFVFTTMPLYTHLQQAQIGTVSHVLLSYIGNLTRDFKRFYSNYTRINRSPLGACAVGGTSINIDRILTSTLLGFDGLIRNSVDATTSRDSLLEYVSNLSILMISLSRIAEDFILWSTSEFGYIELSDKYSSTSSVMPQKKNPDPLEIIRSRTSLVHGNLFSLMSIVNSLSSGYSRDLQDFKSKIFQSTKMVVGSLGVITGIIDTFKVNLERLDYVSNNTFALSLDIAEQLVMNKHIPFRQSHTIIGNLVQKAIDKNYTSLINLSKADVEIVIKDLDFNDLISVEDLIKIIGEITPSNSLQLRKSLGSPNPNEQERLIVQEKLQNQKYREKLFERKNKLTQSLENLEQLVSIYSNG
ncbi:MAG: argininosuccinate lyase [Nitrososphaeraceae archaeon]|nr:argininosuccinate lyase [Nitrososphaeraceae archaeon]